MNEKEKEIAEVLLENIRNVVVLGDAIDTNLERQQTAIENYGAFLAACHSRRQIPKEL